MRVTVRTRQLFDAFALLANTASLHKLDWDRFYRFVRESRQQVPAPTLRQLLIDAGFSPDKAAMLAEVHDHLWTFKRLR